MLFFSSKNTRWGNLFCQNGRKDNESLSDNRPAMSHLWVKVGHSENETQVFRSGMLPRISGSNHNLTCVCTIWNTRCDSYTLTGCCLFTFRSIKHLQLLISSVRYSSWSKRVTNATNPTQPHQWVDLICVKGETKVACIQKKGGRHKRCALFGKVKLQRSIKSQLLKFIYNNVKCIDISKTYCLS